MHPQPSNHSTASWNSAEAERHLSSLELFGMRFGLDRIRRMMTALGSPERRFATIHVVGTNGKSSTTRMIAAILERHGLRTGSYTSPHLTSYTERVQVGERDLDQSAFAAAVARAAWAAERVNHTLAGDDHVTQFELLTAAALWAMAEREVEVAVIEAGLGGRYDATSVIDSRLTVLTNVGLEHTRWLGPTVQDIAAEKLAVLRPGTPLVLTDMLAPEALAVARRVAAERDSQIVPVEVSAAASSAQSPSGQSPSAEVSSIGVPPADVRPVGADGGEAPVITELRARGAFQRRNFALARAAAETYLRSVEIEPRADAVRAAARTTEVPGRLQVVGEEPLTVLDGAHNPDAVQALVESLPELLAARPLALVLGVLEDKDAASMLRELLARCERAWFTLPPSSRALPPTALQSLSRQLGFDAVVCEPEPWRALAEARRWARERGNGAAVLATGSVYLVGDLLGHLADAGADADGARPAHGSPAPAPSTRTPLRSPVR